MSTLIKLVEENVNLKPTDGPSNGHRDEKQDEKKPEEDEACGSEGKALILCSFCMALRLYGYDRKKDFNQKSWC